ncbi:unnamed protein product [Closterium sp. NIES-53]
MARFFPCAAVTLLLTIVPAAAVLPPSALASRTGPSIGSKILASLHGNLASCGGTSAADVRSNVDGTADISILQRGASVYLAYKIRAQGIALQPSSPPAILPCNPCTSASFSSTPLTASTDLAAGAGANTGLAGARASFGGSPSLSVAPAGLVSDVAGAVFGAGRAAGSVAGSAGKAAGLAAGLVGSVAGSAVGTAGKAAGSVGSLAGSGAGLVGSAAGSAVGRCRL